MKARRTTQRDKKRLSPKKKVIKKWCPHGGKSLLTPDYLRVHETEDAGGSRMPDYHLKGKVRCPECNKRLTPKIVYCYGGEYTGQQFPEHKEK